jgi:hypothetical protein
MDVTGRVIGTEKGFFKGRVRFKVRWLFFDSSQSMNPPKPSFF